MREIVAARSSKTGGACTTATLTDVEISCGRRIGGLFVPRLYDRLLRDLAGLELEHGLAEHLRAVRIGARLGEGHAISFSHAGIHFVSHRAAADVVEEHGDSRLAMDDARFARRVIAVDHMEDRVFGIEV